MDAQLSEVKRSLQLLFRDGDTVELRCVGDRTIGGYYRDIAMLAQDAATLNSESFNPPQNVYVCLNPVNPHLYARKADSFCYSKKGTGVKDQDVACRRWLLIDVDPVRPSGVSATATQKQAAIELAKQVYAWLQDQLDGACLVCADSGNGAHILIRLPDLPNSADVAWYCDHLLQLLSDRSSNDQAKIDTTTSNAARICGLYGCVKRKGSDVPGQPHRLSRLLHVPDPLQPVDWARLTALVDPYPGDQPPASQPSGTGEGWQIERLLQDRQIEYTASEDTSNSGERWRKYEMPCPFSTEHSDGFAMFQWQSGAIAAKC